MATETTLPSDFSRIIADEKAAAAALSETLQEQNAVFLNFCSTLTSNILKAMGELNAMELAVATSAAQHEVVKAKETATQNIQPAASSPTPAAAANSEAATASMVQPMVQPAAVDPNRGNDDISRSFVEAMGISMLNAVNAQQQMYITAQAATTETISIILSLGAATLATAVVKKEQ